MLLLVSRSVWRCNDARALAASGAFRKLYAAKARVDSNGRAGSGARVACRRQHVLQARYVECELDEKTASRESTAVAREIVNREIVIRSCAGEETIHVGIPV
jgi:hypothetical protein